MVREILFRGKRLEIGPFIAKAVREWVYGGYAKDCSGVYIYDHLSSHRMVQVEPDTVCQYTGLTDKNGTRIFEGDIVRYGDSIHKVVFEKRKDSAYFGIVMDKNETWDFCASTPSNQMEIVGNIYDDPELLTIKIKQDFGDDTLDYSDVKNNGWIQPYKPVYSMKDFRRLHKDHDALTARFILICSTAYYSREKGMKCHVTKQLNEIEKYAHMDF